jgi:DNA-binding HxlR family transcriptional regulator
LTVSQAKVRRDGTRAGVRGLILIAAPLNVAILEALAEAPQPLVDLRRIAGSPPQTTMRGNLRALAELGVIEKRRRPDFPGSVDYHLADAGHDLRAVAEVVRAWLAASPEGPLELGSMPARSAIKALAEGWSTRIIRALAARPLSLTELDELISGVSYPALERRLSALHLTGQVRRTSGQGRAMAYATTAWLRQAVAPLAAAAQWEGRHLREVAAPISNRDAETAFLLAIPLLGLPADLSGSCRLAVEFSKENGSRLAGVRVDVAEGRVVGCISRLEGDATAWAHGSVTSWFRAVAAGDPSCLALGGDTHLAAAMLDGLHTSLSGLPSRVDSSA